MSGVSRVVVGEACGALRPFTGCSPVSDYTMLCVVGEGTFGEVHKAKCNKDGQLVALKRLRIENEKEGFPITAVREIKLLKYLEHPNIISLRGMAIRKGLKSDDKGEIYMVLPYMEHDLAGLIENPRVTFDLKLIKSYSQQLLRGMEYLHDRNILHRDLKCANLLINNRGELKIGDFGLAREIGEKEAHPLTLLVVTRWYRPPELLLGAPNYTQAIDIWGVGCIISEMIKRKPLFQGTSEMDQLDRIFQVCGSPDDRNWANWRELPLCNNISGFKHYNRQVKNIIKAYVGDRMEYDALMLELIDRLLSLNPKKRPSAAEGCDDPWFTAQPSIPEESHELDGRRARETAVQSTQGGGGGGNDMNREHVPYSYPNQQYPEGRNVYNGRPNVENGPLRDYGDLNSGQDRGRGSNHTRRSRNWNSTAQGQSHHVGHSHNRQDYRHHPYSQRVWNGGNNGGNGNNSNSSNTWDDGGGDGTQQEWSGHRDYTRSRQGYGNSYEQHNDRRRPNGSWSQQDNDGDETHRSTMDLSLSMPLARPFHRA